MGQINKHVNILTTVGLNFLLILCYILPTKTKLHYKILPHQTLLNTVGTKQKM